MIDITNFWGSLPEWVKAIIKPITKTKKSWKMPVYKGDKDWYMNIPILMTWKESLTGGTEKCLDWWYKEKTGKDPIPGESKFTLTLSKTHSGDVDTILKMEPKEFYSCWTGGDDSYYYDPISKITCWLCPYLPWLMDGTPKYLYIKMEVVK